VGVYDKTGIGKNRFPAVFRGTLCPYFSGTKRTLPRKTSAREHEMDIFFSPI
jgi:hypothetical protein